MTRWGIEIINSAIRRPSPETAIRGLFWSFGVIYGIWESWTCRYLVQVYAFHYLDVGDALWNWKFSDGINSYWAPFFSLLLALPNHLLHPSIRWEYPLAHTVSGAIYIASAWCLEFFVNSLVTLFERGLPDPASRWRALSIRVTGYSVFLWFSYGMLQYVTPDLLIGGLLFLMLGLLARIWIDGRRWTLYIALAGWLEVSILSKAVMFPVGAVIVVLAVYGSWRVQRTWRAALYGAVIALVASAILTGPYLIALHHKYNRWTFGDSGTLTYLWNVDRAVPAYEFGVAAPKENGRFLHPVRQVAAPLPLFEFKEPIGGHYPPFFDPQYWHDGVTPVVRLPDLLRIWTQSLGELRGYVGLKPLICLFALAVVSQVSEAARRLATSWFLIVPPVLGISMFATTFMAIRHVWAHLVVLAVVSFACLPPRRVVATLSIWFVFLGVSLPYHLYGARFPDSMRDYLNQLEARYLRSDAALKAAGVKAGDMIGIIGGTQGEHLGVYARLWRTRIGAACLDAREYWMLSDREQEEILDRFHALGVKAVVAERIPLRPLDAPTLWQPLADHFFVTVFPRSE